MRVMSTRVCHMITATLKAGGLTKYFSDREANIQQDVCSPNDRDGCQQDVTSGVATQCTHTVYALKMSL